MKSLKPPIPSNEEARLQALYSYNILDSLHEEVYNNLVKIASTICGTPVALISFVDDTRQWVKAHHGTELKENPRDVSFCSYTLSLDTILEINDTFMDERFKDNPFVVNNPNIRFYAGAPLKSSDGYNIGAICVIDKEPRELSESQKELLMSLAQQVQVNLELRKNISKIKEYESHTLLQLKKLKLLEKNRKELIDLVVHDLKSPLNVIQLSSNIITGSEDSTAKIKKFAENIKISSEKMLRLVMNVLDVSNDENGTLKPVASHFDIKDLVNEVATQSEPRVKKQAQKIIIETDNVALHTDEYLLRRILENLVDNSLKYSPEKGNQILVQVFENTDSFIKIKVSDQGPGIKPEYREKVFQKYARLSCQNDDNSSRESSRGLGLVFCRLAAQALGGKIYIEDNEQGRGSTFCLEIPKTAPNQRKFAA